MVDKLRVLLKRSYSPYSYFRVSAVLVAKDGKEFYGVNVENASYGATICSERNAIFSAVTHGYTKGDFEKLYLISRIIFGISFELKTCNNSDFMVKKWLLSL